jgi:hypothetical protein
MMTNLALTLGCRSILFGLVNLPLLGGGWGVGWRALQQGKPTPNLSQQGNRNL